MATLRVCPLLHIGVFVARIRTIKPDFFHDECLSELSLQHRMTFVGLWLYADRDGRLEDRPKYLKAQLWPYDRCDIEKILTDLEGKFIQRYQLDGKSYIQIVNFLKHQKPHHTEKDSVIPQCNSGDITVTKPLANGEIPEGKEGKGRERKGKEGSCLEIITDLNEVCGTNYSHKTRDTTSSINARFNEGFTVEDFKYVHRVKAEEWKNDPDMMMYLRPTTLYGTKFESYRNQRFKGSVSKAGLKAEQAIREGLGMDDVE